MSAASNRVCMVMLVGMMVQLAPSCSFAQEAVGNVWSKRAWSRDEGNFAADLITTHRHAELIEQWSALKDKPESPPVVHISEQTRRRQPLHIVVLFRGCVAPDGPSCSMMLDYVVRRPDGSEYGAIKDRSLWDRGRAAPDPRLVYLGGPYLEFIAEDDDPLGEYEVTATIRSPILISPISLQRTFEVVDDD